MRPTQGLIWEIILRALASRLSAAGNPPIAEDSNLSILGLVDSVALLDIIVQVESEAGVEFNPEGLDLEEGLTMQRLVSAFDGYTPSGVPIASGASLRR